MRHDYFTNNPLFLLKLTRSPIVTAYGLLQMSLWVFTKSNRSPYFGSKFYL
jgi:hypothetical protein